MVAIPTTQNRNSEFGDGWLVAVFNPQSNTPQTRTFKNVKADILADVPAGGGGNTAFVEGDAPQDSEGSNGDAWFRVGHTVGDYGDVVVIYGKDAGSWAELEELFSASENNVYHRLKDILIDGANVTITGDDSTRRLTVESSGGGGGGGGLNQAAVDARVRAGVLNWAETGNTDLIPTAKLPAQTGGDTTVVGFGLTDIGDDDVGTTWGQIDSITRADMADVIFLDIEYDRTNADLRMSGIIRTTDIPDAPGEYKFQVQGAGGDFISIRFSAAGNAGQLQMQESSAVTNVQVSVYNIAGQASTPSGGGTAFSTWLVREWVARFSGTTRPHVTSASRNDVERSFITPTGGGTSTPTATDWGTQPYPPTPDGSGVLSDFNNGNVSGHGTTFKLMHGVYEMEVDVAVAAEGAPSLSFQAGRVFTLRAWLTKQGNNQAITGTIGSVVVDDNATWKVKTGQFMIETDMEDVALVVDLGYTGTALPGGRTVNANSIPKVRLTRVG